ncbi:MAG: hypothetical protein ABI443_11965 [Chthoniobacterales bacterium]
MKLPALVFTVVALASFTALAQPVKPADTITRIPVVFSGGHDTDPQDRGRPVVLVASALGVPSEVFRKAFSHVHPARGGQEPEPEQVRANKTALMSALGKYGVTNERLDEVSNYYRYPPGRGELWKNKSAVANALVQNGKVTSYEIISGGAGYSSAPTVSVPKIHASATAKIIFTKDLATNGCVTAITIGK